MLGYKTTVEVDQNDEQAMRNTIMTLSMLARNTANVGRLIYDLKHLLTKIEISAEKEINND